MISNWEITQLGKNREGKVRKEIVMIKEQIFSMLIVK
jgi:hypothetical protein